MYKFKVGDKVSVKNSVLERSGVVVERYITKTGHVEYAVDFGDWDFSYFYEDDLDSYIYANSKCECGAAKVYGKKSTRLHHAFWCPVRGTVDEED